jgi:hypothetical protein
MTGLFAYIASIIIIEIILFLSYTYIGAVTHRDDGTLDSNEMPRAPMAVHRTSCPPCEATAINVTEETSCAAGTTVTDARSKLEVPSSTSTTPTRQEEGRRAESLAACSSSQHRRACRAPVASANYA